jgi:predicted SAM-dependent methyltransferase
MYITNSIVIRISPDGKEITDEQMQEIFDRYKATRESIFRRHEMNEVIKYTKGIGVEIGCGLNKIHTAAIGVNIILSDKDYGYPFGAQIRSDGTNLPWFTDSSLDYVFSSHCLEHFYEPQTALKEWTRVLKLHGYLVLILPHKSYYPNIGHPNANKDHKHDFYPSDVKKMIESIGKYEIIQIDTLHEKLKNDKVATIEASKYGHNSLNFSFEIVARKILD